jgi:hypothetical protein
VAAAADGQADTEEADEVTEAPEPAGPVKTAKRAPAKKSAAKKAPAKRAPAAKAATRAKKAS